MDYLFTAEEAKALINEQLDEYAEVADETTMHGGSYDATKVLVHHLFH